MSRKRKYTLNEVFFEELNEKSMYWLGFIYADGYITKRRVGQGQNVLGIKLSSRDHQHLEKFNKDIGTNRPVKKYLAKTKYGEIETSVSLICSNKIVENLEKHGCVTNKSLILSIPDHIRNSFYFNHFIRGYFDGDGSIFLRKTVRNNREYSFLGVSICGTEKVLNSFVSFMPWLKKSCPVYKDTRFDESKNIFSLKLLSNSRSINFYKQIYQNSSVCLERKRWVFEAHPSFSID